MGRFSECPTGLRYHSWLPQAAAPSGRDRGCGGREIGCQKYASEKTNPSIVRSAGLSASARGREFSLNSENTNTMKSRACGGRKSRRPRVSESSATRLWASLRAGLTDHTVPDLLTCGQAPFFVHPRRFPFTQNRREKGPRLMAETARPPRFLRASLSTGVVWRDRHERCCRDAGNTNGITARHLALARSHACSRASSRDRQNTLK